MGLGFLDGGGGGGGGGNASIVGAALTNINGTVLDGYLSQAQVFLDLNGNGIYDSGEPETITSSSGAYTLNATSGSQETSLSKLNG